MLNRVLQVDALCFTRQIDAKRHADMLATPPLELVRHTLQPLAQSSSSLMLERCTLPLEMVRFGLQALENVVHTRSWRTVAYRLH